MVGQVNVRLLICCGVIMNHDFILIGQRIGYFHLHISGMAHCHILFFHGKSDGIFLRMTLKQIPVEAFFLTGVKIVLAVVNL